MRYGAFGQQTFLVHPHSNEMKLDAEQENALKYIAFIPDSRSSLHLPLPVSVHIAISSGHKDGIVNSEIAIAWCNATNDSYESTTEQSKYWFLCMSHKSNTRRAS